MASSINYTIGVDSSKGIANLKNFQSSVKDTSKQMQDAFGAKLKQIISYAAIEEGVRRTAEWATQITQTSKALGVTAEQLQTLQHIASQTGTSEQGITSLFENIQKAREDAIKGNTELITSFAKLGVSLADLTSMDSSQLFSKVMGGLPNDIRKSGDMFQRQAAQEVTGTPENVLTTVKQGMGGQDLAGNRKDLDGSIATEEDVQALSTAWAQIKTDAKELAVSVVPLVSALLAIVKLVTDALLGITDSIKATWDVLAGLVTGNMDKVKEGFSKMGSVLLNAVWGVTGMLFSMFGGIMSTVGSWIKKINAKAGKAIEGIGEDFTTGWDQFKKDQNKALGIDDKTAARGNAIGEAGAIVMTSGEGAAAKGGSWAARTTSTITDKLKLRGLTDGLNSFADKMDGVAAGRLPLSEFKEGSLGAKAVNKISDADIKERVDALAKEHGITNSEFPNQWRKNNALQTPEETQALQTNLKAEAEKQLTTEQHGYISKITKPASNRLAAAGLGLYAGVTASQSEQRKLAGQGVTPSATKPILPWNSNLFNADQLNTGGANLKLGGMFGAGESKIIKLNQKMVEILNAIQANTSPWAGNAPTTQGSRQGGSFGGAAGGI